MSICETNPIRRLVMTSSKQFEANRRNALLSTGPRSNEGKQRSSRNALRHGLTAETVIEPIEDAEDYKAFEEAITADYAAETALERELILRLASLLWRLRRATSIETGLLQMQGLRGQRGARRQTEREFTQVVTLIDPATSRPNPAWSGRTSDTETIDNENGDHAAPRPTCLNRITPRLHDTSVIWPISETASSTASAVMRRHFGVK